MAWGHVARVVKDVLIQHVKVRGVVGPRVITQHARIQVLGGERKLSCSDVVVVVHIFGFCQAINVQ